MAEKDIEDLILRLEDLLEQAEKERSHYYTASLLKEVIQHLKREMNNKLDFDREWYNR